MSRLSRRALRAFFFKLKHKRGQAPKPKAPATLEDLAKAYKLPKVRAPKPKKPAPAPKAPKRPRRIKSKEQPPVPSNKQELVIKIETPQATKPKRRKKQKELETEAPKLEGAAKEAESKTRREKFIEGSETVSAGETYATAASGLFGFLKKRKQSIKTGAKKVGVVGAEGAVAGGAGTAVYKLSTPEEEKKKRKRKRKTSS